MDLFIRRPKFSLLLLTGIALFAFWLTIPLPRSDNQLVGSDGTYYYVYLPSFWLDHDFDFTDEYRYFLPKADFSDSVLPPNKFTIGAPLLWTPFFILGHLIVWLLNFFRGVDLPMDGYGYIYQAFTLSGSILYGGLALWFTYEFVKQSTKQSAALLATILTVFGGNLVYYMIAEPSMSHTVSAACSSLFFLVWSRRRERLDLKTAGLYGLIAGLMALVRPQDGLFLMLPFLAQLPDVWRSVKESNKMWMVWLRNGFAAAMIAFSVFSLQLFVWNNMYGGLFRSGYSHEAFYWFTPKLGAVLFSAYRGLFTWHPVYLLSVIGLVLLYRRDKILSVVGLSGFVIQWYVVGSWHSWYQGDAFGGRMFIVCLPLFALGLAYLIERLEERFTTFAWIYGLSALLLLANFLLFVEYRFDLVLREVPPTWFDITLRRFTFVLEKINQLL